MRRLCHVIEYVVDDCSAVVLSAASAVFPYDDGGLREGGSPGRSTVDVEKRTGEWWCYAHD